MNDLMTDTDKPTEVYMFSRSLFLLPVLLSLALNAAAASVSEGLILGAEQGFLGLQAGSLRFAPGAAQNVDFGRPSAAVVIPGLDLNGFDTFLKQHTTVIQQTGASVRGLAAPVAQLELGGLLNKHLKTTLKFNLGGKDLWISGAFDRDQNAFVSILVDGSEPLFFNVRALLDKEELLAIGTGSYKLSLSPNIINQMESEIVLKNVADRKDRESVTIKEMLDAVSAAGAELKLSDQSYRAFYYDDIKNGRQDKTAKAFAFILTDAKGEIHAFLVPADLVPSDKAAVFKMYNNKTVGLQQAGGKLQVFENP